MVIWITWFTLAASVPIFDPVDGTLIQGDAKEILPSDRQISGMADLWLLEISNLNPSGGGVTFFDDPALSSHGWSWKQTRYFLQGIDMTDPAKPGTPLLDVPYGFWDQLTFADLWVDQPTLHFQANSNSKELQTQVRLAGGTAVGGGTWIPKHFMDREPALAWGAAIERRQVEGSGQIEANVQGPWGRLFLEHVQQAHQYPTLLDKFGDLVLEPAQRTTALATTHLTIANRKFSVLGGYQNIYRFYEGAQYRYPVLRTSKKQSHAGLAQARMLLVDQQNTTLEAKIGLGYRREHKTPRGHEPWILDLVDRWTLMRQPDFISNQERLRLDAYLNLAMGPQHWVYLNAEGHVQTIQTQQVFPGGLYAVTYLRAQEAGNRSVAIHRMIQHGIQDEWLRQFRLEAEAKPKWEKTSVHLLAAIDHQAVGSRQGFTLNNTAPALGATLKQTLGDSMFIVTLRREPIAMDASLAQFIDPARPTDLSYAWEDDGDDMPEPGETGKLLSRAGGGCQAIDPNLKRPTSNLAALGWQSPQFGPFRFSLTGVGRLLLDRYTVVLSGPAQQSYRPTTIRQFIGNTTWPARLRSEDGDLPIYLRASGTEGSEIYLLTNSHKTGRFLGLDLRLSTEPSETRIWFLSLGATGYWNLGPAPYGLFADRNDSGIIHEATADPNQRINQNGSLDSGRAYHVKLLAGIKIWQELRASMAIRYTDGEPMTRFIVIENLPQGPTALMAVPRGKPIPRFTFHMTVDFRLRYQKYLGPYWVAITAEVFNLLGSGTEILERTAGGKGYRQSLEMMPPRTVMVSIEGGFKGQNPVELCQFK